MRSRLSFPQVARSSSWGWVKLLLFAITILVIGGFVYSDYQKSQVVGSKYRYNLVLTSESGEVTFVSFDPQEQQVYAIPFPKNLEIKSRSVGTYRVENLYKLGSYEGSPGRFVRRKVQGFMRVPVAGYIESATQTDIGRQLRSSLREAIWSPTRTSLSRLDALTLYNRLGRYESRASSEEELVRAGVIKKEGEVWQYSHERLRQFVGVRVFDWAIGGESITVAVINSSGVDGLGADIAEFMTNLGFDVVAVKSGSGEPKGETVVTYSENEDIQIAEETGELLITLFGWDDYRAGSTDAYRAKLVVDVGKDAIDLF